MNALFSEPALKKQSIKQVRRRQLTNAAFEVLKRKGLKGTTFERVAKEAGLSKGVVLHYFSDKEALFEAVLRKSNLETQRCVTALLAHAENPWERLYAMIYGNFAPPIFKKEVCHAWVCLCAEVPLNSQYQRIQSVIHSRMRSNLMSALRDLVTAVEAERIVDNLTTLSDGIWLRSALLPDAISTAHALEEIEYGLGKLFAAEHMLAARIEARAKIDGVAKILFK